MNKQLISSRFSKSMASYSEAAGVQRQIADKMIRLLGEYVPAFCPHRVMEFGCGTGIYSRMLMCSLRPGTLLLNDLCPGMATACSDLLKMPQVSFLAGDAETIDFPGGQTLVTSCSALQWFDNPAHFFRKCDALLCEGGYLAFSTFGKENLKEVRRLTGRGLPYLSEEELETALAPCFDLLHAEEELIPLFFNSPMEVLYHLKQTGVNGLTPPQGLSGSSSWTRRDLQSFCERYNREFARSLSVPLTYHPIYIIAKKKES